MSETFASCMESQERISLSDIKTGSFDLQCDIPHQWIAKLQVNPVSVYCDRVGCRVLCLRHGIPVWHYNGQSTTATSRYPHDMTLLKQR